MGIGRNNGLLCWLFVLFLSDWSAAQTSYTVSEEVDKGTVVGNLAKDFNVNFRELQTRNLNIVSGYSKKYFQANFKTGDLIVNERIDREELCPNTMKCTLNLEAILSNPMVLHRIEVFKVQATDSGVPPLSSNVTVNVLILDENDNNPTILAPYSEHGSVNSESIPYSAEAGYFVAKIRAVDADSGYNALLSYHLSEPKGNNLFRIGTSSGEIRTKRRMSDNDLKTHPLVVLVSDNGEPSLSATVSMDVVVVESTADIQTQFRHVPTKEESFSDLNLYLLIAIVSVSVIFLLSLISLIAVKCHRTDGSFSRYSAPMITTHPDGSWSYSKSTQQYDVCFSSDTMKSDVVVFPGPFPPVDGELISINGGDTFTRTQTLPNTDKLSFSVSEEVDKGTVVGNLAKELQINVHDLEKRDLRVVSGNIKKYFDVDLKTVNINSDSGDIVSLQSFNYEEIQLFQFKVQATDSCVPPLSSNVTVNVLIQDENDNNPTILAPYSEHGSVNSESIPYSAEAGYFVAKIRAVDADSGYNALLSYHLSEPKGNNLFRIGTSSGEIRTKRRMSDNDLKTHPLVVLVSDNGEPSLSATVSIDVVVVESTADIQTQFRHVPTKEESFSDLNLYLLIAIVSVSVIFLLSLISLIAVKCHRTDGSFSRYSAPMITTHPDGSWSYSKSTQQYDVCFSSDTMKSDVVVFPGPFPPVDGELISINGGDTFTRTQTLPNTDKTGILSVKDRIDREELCSRNVKCSLEVEAMVNSPLNLYRFEVKIVDINDNAPSFRIPGIVLNVSESAFPGERFTLLRAFDADVGSYSVKGYKLSQNEHFTMDVNGGEPTMSAEMVLQKALDREKQPVIKLTLTAVDGGKPPKSGTLHITVNVQDVNDNIPIFDKPLYKATVLENQLFGTTVISVHAHDLDEGPNGEIVYSFINHDSDNDVDTFSINSLTGEITVKGELDHEKSNAVEIRVQAKDKGSNPRASYCKVLVEIADINDNPPEISVTSLVNVVREDAPLDTMVGLITVRDNDAEKNGAVQTGDIVSLQSFNYEELNKFQFKVQATDSGVPPLSSNVTMNVLILDENDNNPTVLAPYSEHGSVNSESIPYSAEAGYFVAKIRAVDADSGYNALLSYHLSEPKGNNLFRIGTSSGEIRTKRRMSDNDLKTHPLVVLVSDNGEPSLSATVSIDVVVVESTADIQTQFRHVPTKEESFSDLNLYLLIAIVSVSVIFLLSLISLIAVKCHRTDGSFSRYSAPMITTHPDGSWSYSKSTQQYDVCFSSDTMKSDVVVFPGPFPPVDGELISINGGDTFTRTQTLPNKEEVIFRYSLQQQQGASVPIEVSALLCSALPPSLLCGWAGPTTPSVNHPNGLGGAKGSCLCARPHSDISPSMCCKQEGNRVDMMGGRRRERER
ncbi:hypothetical protein NQZ68_008984 [Dissostichus eleginoides]|nr:hypothetical protein NQZ68_008984 [Dissostichus eleginoides]